jgi:hypothetical protein
MRAFAQILAEGGGHLYGMKSEFLEILFHYSSPRYVTPLSSLSLSLCQVVSILRPGTVQLMLWEISSKPRQ